MANIEQIIEKLESLGFIEVVLSTTETFWQKENVKVKFKSPKIVASKPDKELSGEWIMRCNINSKGVFSFLERVAQW